MAWVGIVLEYLKVILSAPVIFGGITLTALLLFKSEISKLIGRIASIKIGGAEVSTPQRSQPSENKSSPPEPPSGAGPELPTELSPQQKQLVEPIINSLVANAYLWEYRYLNHFLVRKTQVVLDWLSNFDQPIAYAQYDSIFLPLIPSAEERATIIQVLQSHHLVTDNAQLNTICLTEKGKEYRQWRGELPPIPPANQSN